MFSLILKILFFVVIIWQVMRFIASLMGAGKKSTSKSAPKNDPNYMVKDPVCGMYMDSRLAVRLGNGNEATYFCSEECKKKFLDKSSGEKSASESNG